MKPKIPFATQYAVGIAHLQSARDAAGKWECACAGCEELRAHLEHGEIKKKRKRAHITALIQLMCNRSRLSDVTLSTAMRAYYTSQLAQTQIEFERIMIRKLKLHHITEAQWYGFKPKKKPAEKISVPSAPISG